MKLLGKMHKYKTMSSYCLKYRKNTEKIIPKLLRISNFPICASKKSKFIKKQEANGLLSCSISLDQ